MHDTREREATIIAEAGINHDGDLERALQMIDAAAAAGADFVKFQSFRADALVTRDALRSSYIVEGSLPGESFRDLLGRLELDVDEMARLEERCRQVGIRFLSTAFDERSLTRLLALGMETIKVASGDLTNLPLLRAMAGTGLPMIVSTGMATLGEIEEALDAIVTREGNDRLTLLHCISWYPAEAETVNLRYMETLRSAFGFPVGYSDHTLGTNVAIAARAMGAVCIEKHFTLDSDGFGPDHAASIEPAELESMVRGIREVEQALGRSRRCFEVREISQRKVHRRSLVTSRPILPGERFTEENLTIKRPGTGIAPKHWDTVLGMCARHSLTADRVLDWDDVTLDESGTRDRALPHSTATAVGQPTDDVGRP